MDSINQYIIDQLKRPSDRLKLIAIDNIIKMLSDEELSSLYDEIASIVDSTNAYDWDAIHKVLRWVRRAKWSKEGGNKTITELIKLYKETGSKLVGDELCERFEYQSFDVQKCIFKTLIRTDHLLDLYPYLNDTWGKILVDDLKQMWEDGITDIGVEYVIKFADEEFIWKHKDEFLRRHYDLVAMRLGNDPRFVVDRKKCGYKWEYYRVMQHLGESVDREQLLEELFETIAYNIKNIEKCSYLVECEYDFWNDASMSAQLIPDVFAAIREFCKMGFHDEVLLFYEWDTSIRQKVDKEIAERYADAQREISFDEKWSIYCNIARRNFPERFAYMVVEDLRIAERRDDMIAELAPLVEKYGLEVEVDMDGSFSSWGDDVGSAHGYKATKIFDDVPF